MVPRMSIDDRTNRIETINAILGKLPNRELAVLERIAVRLLAGYSQYGALTRGKKRWASEAAEEAFDMAVYLSCLLLDRSELDGE